MIHSEEHYLKKFYNELYNNLLLDKKIRKKSILLTFFDIKSNVRYRYLHNSSILSDNIPKIVLDKLIDEELIRESDELNKYVITAKGIWFIEKNDLLNENSLIRFLDDKLFNISLSDKKLTDKEKVILFSMISARTFSEESPIDLKKDEYALNAWLDIINKCCMKLTELNIISHMYEEDLYGKKGNEHPVSHLIRHTDALPKKTKGIYVAGGLQQYYLKIFSDNKVSRSSLIYILKNILISEKIMNIEDIEDIRKFFIEIAYEAVPYVFNVKKHVFSSPDYDDLVYECLRDALYA